MFWSYNTQLKTQEQNWTYVFKSSEAINLIDFIQSGLTFDAYWQKTFLSAGEKKARQK